MNMSRVFYEWSCYDVFLVNLIDEYRYLLGFIN